MRIILISALLALLAFPAGAQEQEGLSRSVVSPTGDPQRSVSSETERYIEPTRLDSNFAWTQALIYLGAIPRNAVAFFECDPELVTTRRYATSSEPVVTVAGGQCRVVIHSDTMEIRIPVERARLN